MVELIAIVVIMASMLLVILPSINNTIKRSEEKDKEEALNSIYMAAENYLMDNYEDHKIDNAGDITYVYITDLINNNYISINTVNPNNNSTFSNKDAVKITRNDDGTFHYELYYFKTLIETLLEQYSPDNTTGLVKDATNENLYYYTGTNEEVANNFLWYGGHQWRVLEFDTNAKTLALITQQPLTNIHLYYDVWKNSEDYEKSYINKWLNNYFYNSLGENIKANILNTDFKIGIYNDPSQILVNCKIGLLDYDNFVKYGASTSFLNINDDWYLFNNYDDSHHTNLDRNGSISGVILSQGYGVRPVMKISDILIKEGEGTLTDSYSTIKKSTNTSNIQVGEYINVPYKGNDNACGDDNVCTFRVVSKDNDSVKIILNGLLNKLSKRDDEREYGGEYYISTNSVVYEVLDAFIDNIPNDYKYLGEKEFYIEDFHHLNYMGQDYEVVKNKQLISNVGLPTIGELFTSNDIDLGITKTFVDIDTIENANITNQFLTMNGYDYYDYTHFVLTINPNGLINFSPIDTEFGVRPVIFLKNNLTFTGGDGTPQNPYTLD